MSNLFKRGYLEQETGKLKPRYLQDGSTIVNDSGNFTADYTAVTVTAGKTLYITDVTLQTITNSNGSITLQDGSGGVTVFQMKELTSNDAVQFTFSTPLVFTDSIYVNEGSTGENILTFSGWEE